MNSNEEAAFRRHLKSAGKQPDVIEGLVGQVHAFEAWLGERYALSLKEASQQHVHAYLSASAAQGSRLRVRGLGLYFAFSGQAPLAELVSSAREAGAANTRRAEKLRAFRGVRAEDAARLEALGVATTRDMLDAGRTPQQRRSLAERSGLPAEVIEDLVHLADLSRIEGVKGIRARLYVDAGVDTLDKLAAWEPGALRAYLVEWVARTGFEGVAPLPKELENTISAARGLPRMVQY